MTKNEKTARVILIGNYKRRKIMNILRSNLQPALYVAIREQTKINRQINENPKFKSALVSEWEAVYDALIRGEEVKIVD